MDAFSSILCIQTGDEKFIVLVFGTHIS